MRFTVKDSVEDVMSNFKGPKIFYTPSDPNLYFFIEELPDLLNLLLEHKELTDEPYSELLSFRQVLKEPALTVFTMKEFESQCIFVRTANGLSKINHSGFLSTYYTISEEKVFQIQ